MRSEAEFKEFEPRLEFETRLKYGGFHLKSYSRLQDLSRRSIETGFWGFKTRLKLIKFELRSENSVISVNKVVRIGKRGGGIALRIHL